MGLRRSGWPWSRRHWISPIQMTTRANSAAARLISMPRDERGPMRVSWRGDRGARLPSR